MTKVILLDNEAAQAIADTTHPKHTDALSYVELAEQRKRKQHTISIVIPTCVRVEACLDHQDPSSAFFNRIGALDISLDKDAASVAAGIRREHGAQISVTDAHIGATVLKNYANDDVTIITSDPDDMMLVTQPVDVNIEEL